MFTNINIQTIWYSRVSKVCDRVKEFISRTQAGFIRGRTCAINLWILRRIAERPLNSMVPVYCALVDYNGGL